VTEVAFHFGAPDKLAYACRLLRTAGGGGARVLVVASAHDVQQLDTDLWAVSQTDFVTHVSERSDPFMQSKSPVLLVTALTSTPVQYGVVVNLTDAVPQGFDHFARVIEVVSTDDADRDLARQRWKHYTGLGYQITRHDLSLRSAGA
jgi:DNA polymerase-3 subunit chi